MAGVNVIENARQGEQEMKGCSPPFPAISVNEARDPDHFDLVAQSRLVPANGLQRGRIRMSDTHRLAMLFGELDQKIELCP